MSDAAGSTEAQSSPMIDALNLVYRRPAYLGAAALLFILVATFYAWAAQVLILDRHGISLLIEPSVIAAIAVLATLFALSLPLQLYAVRTAMLSADSASGTLLGVLVGTASMSCCAPVLLPALLSLVGVSGATILSVNLAIHHYFVPLALLSSLLLGYSVISTASSLARTCVVEERGA